MNSENNENVSQAIQLLAAIINSQGSASTCSPMQSGGGLPQRGCGMEQFFNNTSINGGSSGAMLP